MFFSEFQQKFSSDEDCIEYLKNVLWPNGWLCGNCKFDAHWYQPARLTFQCKQCLQQHSIKAGTIFHRSQSPIKEWLWAIFLMIQSQCKISTSELQHFLGAIDDKRIARMRSRIQKAINEGESLYKIEQFVSQ